MRNVRLALLITCLLTGCAGGGGVFQLTPTLPLNFATIVPTAETMVGEMSCVVVAEESTPQAAESAEGQLFPAPGEDDWSLGPADAGVTFLEYTDYQSSATPALDTNLARLAAAYPDQVRRVFRPFPLPGNDKSLLAAAAAEVAGQQGQFWEMSGLLVEQQDAWVTLATEEFRAWLVEQATGLGLDGVSFAAALDDPAVQQKLIADQQFGLQASIPTMPWLLVNGSIYQGPRDYRSLESLVTLLLLEKQQFHECPPFTIDVGKQYYARLDTNRGAITLQLDARRAPLAVNNFVFLARQGWYDGVTFHRVIPGYVAQAGDPSGSGFGGPGYAFRDDANNLHFDQAGVLAMASSGPDSNGSQFFITYKAIPELNGQYVIFGKVLEGLDVLSRLTPRDPSSSADLPPGDVIRTITIEER